MVTLQAKIEISEDASLLCCSDIIESIFGKFKQKLNKRNTLDMTEFVFTIANFGHHFTAMELDNALEKVSLQTLKDWKIANKNKRQTTYKNPQKRLQKLGELAPSLLNSLGRTLQ